jgi:deoxyadenosine/deoxycytidine kinase
MSYISIEGNIGAGKSTLVKILKEIINDDKILFIQEPVDEWLKLQDENGENILDKFYADTKSWAYKFQMNAFITRLQRLQKNLIKYKLCICERHINTDKNCFAKQLYEDQNISEIEWKLYNNWFNWLTSDDRYRKPKGIIYLKVSPEICSRRINKRNRIEESGVSLEYLDNIHKKHEEWLSDKKNILVIDGDKDFENNSEYRKIVINKIKDYLREYL